MAYLTLNVDELDVKCAYLSKPTTNTVLYKGEFRRAYYSNSSLTLSGIYLLVRCNLLYKSHECGKANYIIQCDESCLERIKTLEENLLDHVPNCSPAQRLRNHLNGGALRFSDTQYTSRIEKIIVKIAGVWNADKLCGLTYKLLPAC